jgi:thioredoxin 1
MTNTEYIKEIDDQNFDKETKNGVTLVDFWAGWCMPCKMQAPILDKVAEHFKGKVNILKVNVDEFTKAAEKFGVMSIPTLILFKDGNFEKQFIGLQSERALIYELENYL